LLSDPTLCSEQAALGGHLHVLKWLWERRSVARDPSHQHLMALTRNAVQSGSLDVIQWLCEVNPQCTAQFDHCFALNAVCYGRLHILEWLLKEQKHIFDEKDCAEAARCGKLDVLKWLRERGCPWNSRTTLYARVKGFKEIFEWAKSHGCPYDADFDGESTESDPDGWFEDDDPEIESS
jgi:hypothetical protein